MLTKFAIVDHIKIYLLRNQSKITGFYFDQNTFRLSLRSRRKTDQHNFDLTLHSRLKVDQDRGGMVLKSCTKLP